MPRLHPYWRVAQRVRYPNGTLSDPFIAPWPKGYVQRFAANLMHPDWRERETAVGHDPESSRLACAHDGRFWATLRLWKEWVCDYTDSLWWEESGRLSMPHMILLFSRDDEYGWAMLQRMGKGNPLLPLARTALAWAETIEEWDAKEKT